MQGFRACGRDQRAEEENNRPLDTFATSALDKLEKLLRKIFSIERLGKLQCIRH